MTVEAGENGTIEADGDINAVEYGSDITFTVKADEGYYIQSITIDGFPLYQTGTFEDTYTFENVMEDHSISATFAVYSGVELINADGQEVIYFNLQGVRVDNPVPGVYVVVRGNKVTREIVK